MLDPATYQLSGFGPKHGHEGQKAAWHGVADNPPPSQSLPPVILWVSHVVEASRINGVGAAAHEPPPPRLCPTASHFEARAAPQPAKNYLQIESLYYLIAKIVSERRCASSGRDTGDRRCSLTIAHRAER